MSNKKVSVFAPATIANVACGFDVLGLAIEQPGDVVHLNINNSDKVSIKGIVGDDGKLPLDANKNTASVAVAAFLEHIGERLGVDILVEKNLPLGSGLGSSAASSAAAVVAINELLGKPMQRKELIPFAMEAERIACGAAHADNVAPAILGGFVLVRSYEPLDIIEIPSPQNLFCVVVHPQIELRTEDARKILKREVQLKDAISQWGNLAALIAGLMKPDFDIIGRSLHDVVAEPLRAILIPGFDEIKKAAMHAGALGCSISGSGPSIFAFCKSKSIAEKAGAAMKIEFEKVGLKSSVYVSAVNQKGATVL
jgi:homoserine kinase